MADKKPSNRSGAPGGDRPMRRPAPKTSASRDDARKTPGPRKPGFDKSAAEKPRGEKGAKPRPAPKPRVTRAKPAPAPVERTSGFEGERIAKAMARAGVCSRRDAEDWIAQGRVAINGHVLTTPAVNVRAEDKVTIDGAPMQERERTRLFLFHKPAGLVTTAHDPEGRPTVFAFLEERHADLPRIVSIGRLDINTEGLLLLTNDGGLARTLELPATGWTRRYRVRVHGEVDQAQLDELARGVTVDDVTYAPIEARLERVQGANAWIAISLTEGKNREVKRVMEHLRLDVTRLIRISYGPFQLGDLAEGAVEEVKFKVLRDQLGKSLAEVAGVDFASPLREATPTEQQETRERVDKRSRKHVSLLRKERDAKSEKGPRARIERGATADRKGRAVVVERVTPSRRKTEDAGETRNARRFEAMRGEGRKPGGGRSSGERSGAAERGPREERYVRGAQQSRDDRRPRFDEQRNERPARKPREGDAERRDARPRGEQRYERRPDDRAGERTGARPERAPRTGGRDEARFEKRPPRRDGDAPRRDARPDSRAGGRSDAPRQERPRSFDKPRGERASADRGERKFDRPREGEDKRPQRGGARGDAPFKGPRSGGGKGAPRSDGPSRGPSRGPARGAGPGKGPPRSRGPGAGGASRGAPSKGPRKPRGA